MPQEAFLKVKGIIQFTNWNSLYSNGPLQINFMSICMVLNSRYTQTNNPLTYVLTTAKLDATGHRWVATLSNYTFSIIYKPGKGHVDTDALSHIRWPEAMEINPQTVQGGTLCHGVQIVDALSQDYEPPGMTPLEWCQAQSKDPAIHQIIDEIQNKTIGKLKINGDMPSELKALIRLKRQLALKQGVLYKRTTQVNTKTDSN